MAVRRILTLSACASIAQGIAGPPALASPRSDPTAGRAVFTGATMPHATSISLDPAALGLGSRNELYLALTSVLQQLDIERRTLDVGTGALAPGASVDDTQLAPGAGLAFIWQPRQRLTLGFEARVPPSEVHPEGHDPLRYHTLGGGQRTYAATAGFSLRLTSALYFGVSVSHENTFVRLRYARDTALEAGRGPGGIESDCAGAPCGVENPAATELYDADVRSAWLSADNLRVNLGTVIRLYPDIWLGLAYHAPPGLGLQTTLDGTMTVTRAPRDGGEVLRGRSAVSVSLPASVDAELRARLPADLELHVGGRWEDLSRLQAYDVRAFGSTFRNAGIPEWTVRARGLEDAVATWAGVEQLDLGQAYRLGARVGFETAAVPEARTSALTAAPTSLTFDAGAQLRLQAWTVQVSYGLAYALPVSVEDSAYDPRHRLACIDSGFDYTTAGCAAARDGYALPTAAGEYRRIDHAFRIGFRYELP